MIKCHWKKTDSSSESLIFRSRSACNNREASASEMANVPAEAQPRHGVVLARLMAYEQTHGASHGHHSPTIPWSLSETISQPWWLSTAIKGCRGMGFRPTGTDKVGTGWDRHHPTEQPKRRPQLGATCSLVLWPPWLRCSALRGEKQRMQILLLLPSPPPLPHALQSSSKQKWERNIWASNREFPHFWKWLHPCTCAWGFLHYIPVPLCSWAAWCGEWPFPMQTSQRINTWVLMELLPRVKFGPQCFVTITCEYFLFLKA